MIKWVNINHILSSKICNKNVENHHCKSDCAKTYVKIQEYCKYKPDLSLIDPLELILFFLSVLYIRIEPHPPPPPPPRST